MRERFNHLLDYGWLVVEHGLKMRSNDLQHQHVMFPVYTLNLEMVQEREDVVRSWVRPRSGRKMTMDLDFAIPAGKFGHGKLEGDVSAVVQRGS